MCEVENNTWYRAALIVISLTGGALFSVYINSLSHETTASRAAAPAAGRIEAAAGVIGVDVDARRIERARKTS